MEIRVLEYFLAVAREQSISAAAQSLHLSQPTLSRQLKSMEEDLGKQLLIRGNRKITLTEEGMILRKRAEEILDLVNKTEKEITISEDTIAGEIYIGSGETDAVRLIARAAHRLRTEHPHIHYHISSGDSADILEKLDKGLIDFGLLLKPVDTTKYHFIKVPLKDQWGVLMKRDSPLAEKEAITPDDLWDKPLIISRQFLNAEELFTWMKRDQSKLNIAATYNLVYNASLMADENLGYAICLNRIINTTNTSLCFRPLSPKLEIGLNFVWKKHQVFSKAAEKFLYTLRQYEKQA